MNEPTLHFALFQGDHASDEDAVLIGTFSTEKRAEWFRDEVLSKAHTELKREVNDIKERNRKGANLEEPYVPDLYWDIRPVAHDPRAEEEL